MGHPQILIQAWSLPLRKHTSRLSTHVLKGAHTRSGAPNTHAHSHTHARLHTHIHTLTRELGLHVNCGYADDKAPHNLWGVA